MSPPADAVLFRSENLLARWRGGFGKTVCVVTFASYTYEYSVDRPGFGEAFLIGEGIDAIHVTTRRNRWYDEGELAPMLECIRDTAQGYATVATYGSSMGAFAALHFAGHVGARIAIGISPQFAIDGATVPFERRWRSDARGVGFPAIGSCRAPREYLFYDPMHRADARHAGLFRSAKAPVEIAIPFAGHPAGAVLDQTDLLKPAIRQILGETFDPAALRRAFRARRRRSSQYLWTMADALPERSLATSVKLARMALASQRTPHSLRHLAAVLVKTGEKAEPETLLREAIALAPDDIHAGVALARLYDGDNRKGSSAEILRRLRKIYPRHRLIRLEWLRNRLSMVCLTGIYDMVETVIERRSRGVR